MTNADAQGSTLVLKDQAGEYFLLSQETLERGRVPEEHKTEVERLLVEGEGDDVAGHIAYALGFLTGVFVTGALGISVVAYGRTTGTLNAGLHR